MSGFCPEWIYSICSAKTAGDFLATNNSINMLSKKFSKELSKQYNEIKYEEITDAAEKILQFLSEVNAGEEAVNFINDYIFYRVNFNSNGTPRKISSMFSSAFDSEKVIDYNNEKIIKIFKATVFSQRNGVYTKATPGWIISDVEDVDWLGDLFEATPDLNDL